jgi:hypothetical protein
MWYLWDDHIFSFTTLRRRATFSHLQQHPQIAFVVDDDDVRSYRGVLIRGRAALAPSSHWAPVTQAIARHYLGATDGDRYARYMLGQIDRVTFRVTPTGITHWGFARPDSVARVRALRT